MEISEDEINELERLQWEANPGMGVQTIRYIVSALRRGNLSEAQAVWGNDGDKLNSYSALRRAVTRLLGCRVHCERNCDNWLCRRIEEYHRE